LALPFAVTTRSEGGSHRQDVIGYDRVLDTFLLRDPTGNFRREYDATWLEGVLRRGGECALLLPAEVAARTPLPSLPLEAETMAWLQARLDWQERRPREAERAADALMHLPPGPLRFDVELMVAQQRGDRRRRLELFREASAAAADDPYWQYYWAIELLDQRRWQEARALLDRLLALSNDLGLLSEEYDPTTRRLLGNFPQAFTHVALVISAFNLTRFERPVEQRARPTGEAVAASVAGEAKPSLSASASRSGNGTVDQ
jgi:tetratricopeptide (TPR) repeat protein